MTDQIDERYIEAMAAFERAWAEGRPPDLREFAARYDGLGADLRRDLLVVDFDLRWQADQGLPFDIYLNQFQGYVPDLETVMDLIGVEIKHMPSEPDPEKYSERVPREFADQVRSWVRCIRLFYGWDSFSALPGELRRSLTRARVGLEGDRNGSPAAGGPSGSAAAAPGSDATGTGPGWRHREGDTISLGDAFRIDSPVRRGGFKEVYRATQGSSHRTVALKRLLVDGARAVPHDLRRLINECHLQSMLAHQNIPPVHLLGESEDGTPAVQVERLVSGPAWSETLRDRTLRENLRILGDVAQALKHAHGRGVIHRDVNPNNVVVNDAEREVFLVDWGLGLYVGDAAAASPHVLRPDQDEGSPGMPAYIPPEMARGDHRACSKATDVYLLGASLYEVLTGRPPFGDCGPWTARERSLKGRLDPPVRDKDGRPNPAELVGIVMRAMDVDTAQRLRHYPDAGQFAEAIERYLGHADAAERGRQAARRLGAAKEAADRARSPRELAAQLVPMIEGADQLRQAGEAWDNESDLPTRADDEGFREIVAEERRARWWLSDLASRCGDFELARAQLDRLSTLLALAAPPETASEEAVASEVASEADLAARRRHLDRQVKRRQRARLLARAALAAFVMATAAGGLALYSQAQRRLAEAREAYSQSQRRLAEARENARPWIERATVDTAFGFQQSAAHELAQAISHTDEPTLRNRWVEAVQLSLAPRLSSSRRVSAGSLAYSTDGSLLAAGDRDQGAIHIWGVADGQLRHVLRGHSRPKEQQKAPWSTIRALAFRPKSTGPGELISIGIEGTIRGWDATTGLETWREPPQGNGPAPLLALAVEPGPPPRGEYRMLTGDDRGTLTWWARPDDAPRPPTGQGRSRVIARVERAHSPHVNVVCYRPDGLQAASAGPDGVVRLWDSVGTPLRTLTIARDGPKVEGAARNQGEATPKPVEVFDLAYRDDGRQLAAAAGDGRIYVWELPSGKPGPPLEGHEAGPKGDRFVRRVVYGATRRLISAGADGTVRAWDVDAGRQLTVLGRHPANAMGYAAVGALAVLPTGLEFATAGLDLSIRRWRMKDGAPVARLEGLWGRGGGYLDIAGVAYHAGENLLITAGYSYDAFLRSWDTRSLRERRTYASSPANLKGSYPRPPTALAVSPDGRRVAVAEHDGETRILETQTGRVVHSFVAHLFPFRLRLRSIEPNRWAVTSMAWSHDGRSLATTGPDDRLKLWDVSGEQARPLGDWAAESLATTRASLRAGAPVPSSITSLQFDRDDKWIITGGLDGIVRYWDRSKGEVAHRLTAHAQPVTAMTLSSDSALLATGGFDGNVKVWDIENRELVRELNLPPRLDAQGLTSRLLPSEAIHGLGFSGDSRLLAVGQEDGTLTVVDVVSGIVLHRGIGHEWHHDAIDNPLAVFFTRDGDLLTVGGDATLRRWDLRPRAVGVAIIDPRPLRQVAASADRPDRPEWGAVTGRKELVRWGPDGKLVGVWTTVSGESPTALAYLPKSPRLAVTTGPGHAFVIELDAMSPKQPDVAPAVKFTPEDRGAARTPNRMSAIAVNAPGKLAATNWEDETIDVWSTEKGSSVARLRRQLSSPPSLIDIERDKVRACALAFHPVRAEWLAAAYGDGTLLMWDVSSGKPLRAGVVGPPLSESAGGLSFSHDGRWLAHGGSSGEVAVWNSETGERAFDLHGSRDISLSPFFRKTVGRVGAVAFSPRGKWLACCGDDGTIRLWDAAASRREDRGTVGEFPLATVVSAFQLTSYRAQHNMDPDQFLPERGNLDVGNALAFSADERRLLVGGQNSPTRLLDIDAIVAPSKLPPSQLAAASERITGLRRVGEHLEPIPRGPFVADSADVPAPAGETSGFGPTPPRSSPIGEEPPPGNWRYADYSERNLKDAEGLFPGNPSQAKLFAQSLDGAAELMRSSYGLKPGQSYEERYRKHQKRPDAP